MTDARGTTNAYLVFLVLLTIGLAGVAVRISEPPGVRDALLALLVVGCTVLAIAVPVHVGPQQKLTLYGSVVFAAVLLLGPILAITSVGLGTVVGQLLRRVPKVELLFNVLQTMLQTAAGGCVLWWAGWNFDTLAIGDEEFVPILLLTILAIEAVNIVLVAGMIALESNESFISAVRTVARQDLVSMVTPYALGLLAAIVIDAHLWAFPLLALLAVEVRRSSERHAELRQQAIVMEHLALHDALTGLPNRRMFVARVEQALARATHHHQRLTVMFVDLDRFKIVNDTLGHLAGDQLLIAVTQRLSHRIRQQDTFARLGGDEFTLLAEDIEDTRDAEAMAHRLVESLQDPFVIDGHRIAVSASIGFALNPPGQTTADDVIRQADIALYHAKARGGNTIVSFTSRDNTFSLERMTLETDLQQAVTNNELRLYYQPQVDLITARVTAVEALLRWEHPERGLLSPSVFLPFAEESGLIVALGHWVLHEASQQARIWHQLWADHAPTVSVNLSVRQIHETNLSRDVVTALEIAGLPPHLLGLEVTEGIMFARSGEALLTMQRLKELGVKLVIDDFGTGYSGLSYLKHIPADELKIDQSFVRGLDNDAGDRVIVEAIHTLAHSFGMRVVAEGVETSKQLEQLQAIGCDAGQGFYFSRPVPADELTPLVRDGCLISPCPCRAFVAEGVPSIEPS